MPDETTVHIVDDDEALRESVAFLLDTAGLRCKTYDSAAAFLAVHPVALPACLITDVRMPGMTGLELVRSLSESGKHPPIIVITAHGDIAMAVEAMKLGAADFIEKPFDDEVLLSAVRAALDKHASADEIDAGRANVNARLSSLSGRERQVLEGLVSGNPNKKIAYDLGISPRTVEVYRANLMTKMQASSLSELVRMALLAKGFGS